MLLCLFSILKITLALDVVWKRAVVDKDLVGTDSVNEVILQNLGQDRIQVFVVESRSLLILIK